MNGVAEDGAARDWTQAQVETAQIMITIQGCSFATVALAIGKSRHAVAGFVRRRGWQAPAGKTRQPKARQPGAPRGSIRPSGRGATAAAIQPSSRTPSAKMQDRGTVASAPYPVLPAGLFVFTGMAGLSRRARAGRAVLAGKSPGGDGPQSSEGS